MDVYSERSYPTPLSNSTLLPLLLLTLAKQKHVPKISRTFNEQYDYVVGKKNKPINLCKNYFKTIDFIKNYAYICILLFVIVLYLKFILYYIIQDIFILYILYLYYTRYIYIIYIIFILYKRLVQKALAHTGLARHE